MSSLKVFLSPSTALEWRKTLDEALTEGKRDNGSIEVSLPTWMLKDSVIALNHPFSPKEIRDLKVAFQMHVNVLDSALLAQLGDEVVTCKPLPDWFNKKTLWHQEEDKSRSTRATLEPLLAPSLPRGVRDQKERTPALIYKPPEVIMTSQLTREYIKALKKGNYLFLPFKDGEPYPAHIAIFTVEYEEDGFRRRVPMHDLDQVYEEIKQVSHEYEHFLICKVHEAFSYKKENILKSPDAECD